ncbi:ABC transporter ATP-binding protein [Billgrantia gudaonensis]|uniref:Peptide/nickel transport system ATP-binding protein n=1 Tax=Billgrantia gudaonensis TaxID=376427 RepID=A0A1G9B692_9GAMM|nr:ABC transporter ATP-binding protein [Halomonas gudaonensis]SDK35052.1 peptide/nickel transport system ATP-binding protein [Halomonas gudaonensis]
MSAPLLEVSDLHVRFGDNEAVKGLDFTLHRNETLALVGESGSGKSATALAILRLIEREGGTITRGRIRLFDEKPHDLTRLSDRQMQAIRGRLVSMVFQEPMTALNPTMTVGRQLTEVLERHASLTRRELRRQAVAALERVQVPRAAERLGQYPHELSGGQRQRVMIAMALATGPRLLIADEPSTALDVTTQAEILALLRRLQAETEMGVLFITHDLGVVAEMADRVLVLKAGRQIESAPARALFTAPQAPYTRRLLDAAPRLGAGSPTLPATSPLLEVSDLVTAYPGRRAHPFAARQPVRAVDGVSLQIGRGETLGLVGESGCGKSSLARSILRLAPIQSGSIRLEGSVVSQLHGRHLLPMRRAAQMIFQDPFASLNPRLPAWKLVTEPALIHGLVGERERRDLAASLLSEVTLDSAHLDRYPHQFSGGQRQRLCIARALSVRPRLIVADEPVSALDVSIARQVTELLQDIQQRHGLSLLFITHDMAVVERISHRLAVMLGGRIVETGPTAEVLTSPRHDYTRKLIDAVPHAEIPRRVATAVSPPERHAAAWG